MLLWLDAPVVTFLVCVKKNQFKSKFVKFVFLLCVGFDVCLMCVYFSMWLLCVYFDVCLFVFANICLGSWLNLEIYLYLKYVSSCCIEWWSLCSPVSYACIQSCPLGLLQFKTFLLLHSQSSVSRLNLFVVLLSCWTLQVPLSARGSKHYMKPYNIIPLYSSYSFIFRSFICCCIIYELFFRTH